jgi:hypothetical protein
MTESSKHISFETLLDIADEHSKPGSETASHLSDCARCADQMQRVEGLVRLMREDQSVDAPRGVLAYAVNIFAQRRAAPRSSFVKRLVAALSFDSFERAPAFGVRSGPGAARQLLYSAGDNDIDLRINEQENNRWAIAGQVLGEHCAGGEISLHGYEVSNAAYLNEQCEFTLPAVPAGTYELVVRLADLEVEVPRLEIGI